MTTIRKAVKFLVEAMRKTEKNDILFNPKTYEYFLNSLIFSPAWFFPQEKRIYEILGKYENFLKEHDIDYKTLEFESNITKDASIILLPPNFLQGEILSTDNILTRVKDIKAGNVPNLLLPVKVIPYEHQKKAFAIATTLDACALFMEMGCGKTLVGVAVAGYRYKKGEVKKVLIICPKSVIPVWRNEFEKYADFPVSIFSLNGQKETFTPTVDKDKLTVYIINYESTWRREIIIGEFNPDMVILDESQHIKSHISKQSKFCHKLGDRVKYKLILSGTPISQSLIDGFSQFKFLNKNIFGSSITKFRDKYCIMGGYKNHQIVGYKNQEEFAKKLHSISYRVTLNECTDMPDTVDKIEYCYLNESRKIYDELAREMVTMVQGTNIAVVNILAQLHKLQQVTGGFLPVEYDDGHREILKVGEEKLNLLESVLRDLPSREKVVIFVRYNKSSGEVIAICDRLASLGRKYVVLTGETKNRGEVIKKFQADPSVTAIVAQIQVGGVGIELNAARYMIFYSLDFNADTHTQAKGRIRRMNKKQVCVYIYLLAKNTIDEKIFKALQKKQDMAKYIVDELKKAPYDQTSFSLNLNTSNDNKV